MQGYEDLDVYHRSMEVLVSVHELIRNFPSYELYELCSQIRRASKSIPCNIAEGYGKKRSVREFVSYLAISMGSANEMVVHLEISRRLGYISDEDSNKLQEDYRIIGKMLNRLINSWESRFKGTAH
jgi:four helix bundle protein